MRWGEILIAHYTTDQTMSCQNTALYIIPQGIYWYFVAYSASKSEFAVMQPSFAQSIATFSSVYGD
jgi:hypothetical protein